MNPIQIDIVNLSSLKDAEVFSAIPAMQAQVEEDFKRAWGYGADLHMVAKGGMPAAMHWWIGIFDRTDEPGALGYHDMTSTGLPLGRVFQLTDKQYGEDWRTTLSHELLEMLLDPYVNLSALFQKSGTTGTLTAYEACDAVQGDTYDKLGVPVSNFLLPAYFEPGPHLPGTRYDHLGLLHGCFPAIRPGGYYSYLEIGKSGGWKQKMGERAPARKARPHNGSRRELRSLEHDARRASSVESRR